MHATTVFLWLLCRACHCCGLQASQLGKVIWYFLLEACMTPCFMVPWYLDLKKALSQFQLRGFCALCPKYMVSSAIRTFHPLLRATKYNSKGLYIMFWSFGQLQTTTQKEGFFCLVLFLLSLLVYGSWMEHCQPRWKFSYKLYTYIYIES